MSLSTGYWRTGYRLLAIAYCLLPIVYCLLPIASCLFHYPHEPPRPHPSPASAHIPTPPHAHIPTPPHPTPGHMPGHTPSQPSPRYHVGRTWYIHPFRFINIQFFHDSFMAYPCTHIHICIERCIKTAINMYMNNVMNNVMNNFGLVSPSQMLLFSAWNYSWHYSRTCLWLFP